MPRSGADTGRKHGYDRVADETAIRRKFANDHFWGSQSKAAVYDQQWCRNLVRQRLILEGFWATSNSSVFYGHTTPV